MDVQKLTHEVRLQQWGRTVQDCRSSGKSIKSWCDGQNINIKTYYYWQKKVCQATCRELAANHSHSAITVKAPSIPVFTELHKPDLPLGQLALTLQRGPMEIQIYRGADAAIVEAALLAFRSLC